MDGTLHAWIGSKAASESLAQRLRSLSADSVASSFEPDVKAYSDVVYYNYYDVGLSLVFAPSQGYKIKSGSTRESLNEKLLNLTSIDVYNHEAKLEPPSKLRASASKESTSKPKSKYGLFPAYPVRIQFTPPQAATDSVNENATGHTLDISPGSVGKDFVQALGEPDRKGGGEGSLGIWTEWTKHGVMVEFASAGAQAWDKGGEATWRTLTIFEPGVSVT